MKIIEYEEKYSSDVISLILDIQNNEAKIDLSLEEQPDLLDVRTAYFKNGGRFWLAVEEGSVIGTIALMMKENDCGVLKKFFVRSDCRRKKVGLALYEVLMEYARLQGLECIILDTPSAAEASHRFYERSGFKRITPGELPVHYEYPDRNSYLYLLAL